MKSICSIFVRKILFGEKCCLFECERFRIKYCEMLYYTYSVENDFELLTEMINDSELLVEMSNDSELLVEMRMDY